MRVLIRGGKEEQARLIAAALTGGGLVLAEEAAPFDILLTLGEPDRIVVGALCIDLARRRVARSGRPVRLTATEFAILGLLARAARPVPRAELLREVWNYRFDPGTNMVAAHMSRLRAKIGGATVAWTAAGYILQSDATDGPHAPRN
jgi:two-component system, OmpR family, response regulator